MLGVGPVTVIHEDVPGNYVNGEYVRGETSRFTIEGSIMPANPKEVEILEEGAQTRARWSLYCDEYQRELKTTDLYVGAGADRVLHKDKEYLLAKVGDWTDHEDGLPHRAYLLIEIGKNEARDPEEFSD
jgi:hypothetical protein